MSSCDHLRKACQINETNLTTLRMLIEALELNGDREEADEMRTKLQVFNNFLFYHICFCFCEGIDTRGRGGEITKRKSKSIIGFTSRESRTVIKHQQ